MAQEQLDLSDEKCEIEHLLRGHVMRYREDGSSFWDENIDENEAPFNEYGVKVIMQLVSFYLSKRKLLSNYDEDMINQKMEDFSTELADLIFMKYREMGLNNADKKKMYSAIVREIYTQVVRSKWAIKCGLCSPCYPGQGDPDSVGEFVTYSFPPDMFEDEKFKKKIFKL